MRIIKSLLEIDLNMEDKLDLMLAKIMQLEKSIDAMRQTMEQHRVEHGFDKMQPGGINKNFGGDSMSGHSNMPPGMGGMDRGYGMPGAGMPPDDPSMPPF